LALAQLDNNQFNIVSINYFTGNPHLRTSMSFNVTFADETVDLDFNHDFADTQQFRDYTRSKPILFPLTGTRSAMLKAIALKRTIPITDYNIGQTVHLDLRIYDGLKASWFDTLDLPDKPKAWVSPVTLVRWTNDAHTSILCSSETFRSTIVLNSYDFYAYVTTTASFSADTMVLVTAQSINDYPAIFAV
jgi:hypothetical protein